jgi:hypothetical protein
MFLPRNTRTGNNGRMEGGLVRSAMNELFVSMALTRPARADNPETIKYINCFHSVCLLSVYNRLAKNLTLESNNKLSIKLISCS